MERAAPRATSTRLTESSLGVPSGSSAGVSTALCRAYTPGTGRPAASPGAPSVNRLIDSSFCVARGWVRSRWVSVMAPTAAVISSAATTSKAHT